MITTDFWIWATVHWWLGFWIVFWAMTFAFLAFASVISLLGSLLFRLPNRMIRSSSIRARGWPPEHLDADGEFKPKAEKPDSQ